MAKQVLRFKASTTAAVTTAAVDAYVNNSTDQIEVRLISDRATHVSVIGTATDQDALVPAECIELLQVDPGKTVSVLREASETDGLVWVTEIQRV